MISRSPEEDGGVEQPRVLEVCAVVLQGLVGEGGQQVEGHGGQVGAGGHHVLAEVAHGVGVVQLKEGENEGWKSMKGD